LNKIIPIKVLTENKWLYDISLQLTIFKTRSPGLKVVQKGWALTQKKSSSPFHRVTSIRTFHWGNGYTWMHV